MELEQQQTPFSPHSFQFYPGSPTTPHEKNFRFAGAPDGPLPSIPSDQESDEDQENYFLRPSLQTVQKRRPSFAKPVKRFPFLTLIASILATFGGIVFAVSSHKVTDLILVALQEVFHTSYEWLEAAEIVSTLGGSLIAALSILTLSASLISVYQRGSEVKFHLILMVLFYPTLYAFGFFMAISVGSTFVSMILDELCYNDNIKPIWAYWNQTADSSTVCSTILEGEKCINCIDLYPFHFIFPPEARKEDMWICGREIYLFCDEDLPSIVNWWIVCLTSSISTLIGIIVHLHDLSWTRTEIMEQNKANMAKELFYIRSHVKSALYK